MRATAYADLSWDDLRIEIAAGRPVIVWVIGDMWNGTPVTYTAADGETTTVAFFEHTMILTGYTRWQVYMVDAYTGLPVTYDLNAFQASWRVLGHRAILAGPEEPTQTPLPSFTPTPAFTPTVTATPTPVPTSTPTPQPTPPRSVLVHEGDTLVGLAVRYQVTWKTLIQENGLIAPYFIYPGEELRLPVGATLLR